MNGPGNGLDTFDVIAVERGVIVQVLFIGADEPSYCGADRIWQAEPEGMEPFPSLLGATWYLGEWIL